MAKIHRLDQHMINMIAAGEVIERPASVVKELMENAIDAGATEIIVAVEDGGRKEIRITDNGCGMDPDDLSVAFDTHATSKIQSSQDLRAIGTLGFRGEALASIASVAHVKAVTRLHDSPSAHCLEIDCGQRNPVAPCSGAPGTTFTIRDLFYKLPARQKFMRTAQTEMGHISEQFIRIALGSLGPREDDGVVTPLNLTLIHNGREIYRLSKSDDLMIRVRSMFPMLNISESDDLIDVEQADKGLRVWGLVGHPDLARSNSKFQYTFLNGRFIRDKTVTHAIKQAYRGLLEPSRFPVVFLFLEMPLDDYDVNVHPTKTEVRFFNSQLVHSQVLSCVRERLLGVDMRAQGELPSANPTKIGGGGEPTMSPPAPSRPSGRISDAMEDFFKSQRARVDMPRHERPSAAASYSAPAPVVTPPSYEMPLSRPAPVEPLAPEPTSVARRYLQVHDSYILAETEEGFVIVDQHALHEKVIYERLCEKVNTTGLASQRMLIPESISLSDAQANRLQEHAELLKKLGIEVDHFGPQTYAVQSFPTVLQKANIGEFIQELVDLLDEHQGEQADQVVDAVLSMAACKAAIKAHQALSPTEIQQLLDDGYEAECSSRCPHGRPTTIRFTLKDLAKQFLRE